MWHGVKKVIKWNETFLRYLDLFITRNKTYEKANTVVLFKLQEIQEQLKKWDVFQLCSLAAVWAQTDVTFSSCLMRRDTPLQFCRFLESCVYLCFHSYLNVGRNMFTLMSVLSRHEHFVHELRRLWISFKGVGEMKTVKES